MAADAEEGAVGATNGHSSHERMDVVVTEIVDGGSFWAQKADELRVAWLQDQMRLVSGTDPGPRVRRCTVPFLRKEFWYIIGPHVHLGNVYVYYVQPPQALCVDSVPGSLLRFCMLRNCQPDVYTIC